MGIPIIYLVYAMKSIFLPLLFGFATLAPAQDVSPETRQVLARLIKLRAQAYGNKDIEGFMSRVDANYTFKVTEDKSEVSRKTFEKNLEADFAKMKDTFTPRVQILEIRRVGDKYDVIVQQAFKVVVTSTTEPHSPDKGHASYGTESRQRWAIRNGRWMLLEAELRKKKVQMVTTKK